MTLSLNLATFVKLGIYLFMVLYITFNKSNLSRDRLKQKRLSRGLDPPTNFPIQSFPISLKFSFSHIYWILLRHYLIPYCCHIRRQLYILYMQGMLISYVACNFLQNYKSCSPISILIIIKKKLSYRIVIGSQSYLDCISHLCLLVQNIS